MDTDDRGRTNLTVPEVELVLAAVGREFSQHDGRRRPELVEGPAFSDERLIDAAGAVVRIGRNSGLCSSSPWPAASR